MHAIIRCEGARDQSGEVIAVAETLDFAFGTIRGPVVGLNTIRCPDGVVFYLVENAPSTIQVGQRVKLRPVSIIG